MPEFETGPSVDAIPHPSSSNSASSDQKSFIEHVSDTKSNPDQAFSLTTVFAFVATALVLLEVGLMAIIISTNKSAVTTQDAIIASKTQELAGPLRVANEQATRISHGIKAYAEVKGSQRDFDTLWKDLRNKTIAGSRIKSLTVDEAGAVKLQGEAKSFVDVATFIASFKQASAIKGINLVTSTTNDKTKEFSLSGTFVSVKSTNVTGN